MNRRDLLKLAPAALAATPAAALCVVDPAETPVMRLFREWLILDRDESIACETDDEAAQDEIMNRKLALERQMRDAPQTSPVDIALVVVAMSDFGMFEIGAENWGKLREQARALIA